MRANAINVIPNFVPVFLPSPDLSLSSKLVKTLIHLIDQDCGDGIRLLLSEARHLDMMVNEIKKTDLQPLHQAVINGKNRALSALLAMLPLSIWLLPEPHMRRTPLMLAADNGNADFIENLWDTISNRLLDYEINFSALEGNYLRHSLMKEFDCVQEMKQPAEKIWLKLVDAKDREGNTPILLSVQNNHVQSTVLLVKLGADYTISNESGENARGLAFSLPADLRIQRLFVLKPYFSMNEAGTI